VVDAELNTRLMKVLSSITPNFTRPIRGKDGRMRTHQEIFKEICEEAERRTKENEQYMKNSVMRAKWDSDNAERKLHQRMRMLNQKHHTVSIVTPKIDRTRNERVKTSIEIPLTVNSVSLSQR